MPARLASFSVGSIFIAICLTRSVAPAHQCLSHISVIMIAVLEFTIDCSKRASTQESLPRKGRTEVRRGSRVLSPTVLARLIARNAKAPRKTDIVLIDVFLMIMPPCLAPKSMKLRWIAGNPFLSLRRPLFQSKHKQPAGTVFGQEVLVQI